MYKLLGSLVIIAVVAVPPLDAQEMVKVSGKVVDHEGSSVAGAQVSTFFSFEDGKEPMAVRPMVSDKDGSFQGEVEVWRDKFAVGAYSSDWKFAGYLELTKQSETKDLTITVNPTVQLRGKIVSKSLGKQPSWTDVYFYSLPSGHRMGRCMSRKARFEMPLPPGEYELWLHGADIPIKKKKLTLSQDKPVVDLGEIDLPASFLALQKGKELPPWKVTAARNIDPEKTALSNFRGKWLLVEFWVDW